MLLRISQDFLNSQDLNSGTQDGRYPKLFYSGRWFDSVVAKNICIQRLILNVCLYIHAVDFRPPPHEENLQKHWLQFSENLIIMLPVSGIQQYIVTQRIKGRCKGIMNVNE